MVSSDEINKRLKARRRGVDYQGPRGRPTTRTAGTRECPNCHTTNPTTAKFCIDCGEKLETPAETVTGTTTGSTNTKECPNCHAANPATSKFCVKCGQKLETPAETGFTPEIKGPESDSGTTTTSTVTQPPDAGFGGSGGQQIQPNTGTEKKLEPIVPPTAEPTPVTPDSTPTSQPHAEETPVTPKTDSDPVERIKKAKGLLDIGAITQEEFDGIQNKYLESDTDPLERIKKAKNLLDIEVITPEEFAGIKNKYLESDPDPVEIIKKGKNLLDSGVINQEEFDSVKKEYLDDI